MVRALTKRKKDGTLYERPANIEAQLRSVLELSLEELLQRVQCADRKSTNFIPQECLVHLLRNSLRADDQKTMRAVLPVILTRCERTLFSKVPDGSFPHAETVREDILGEFQELFLRDGTGDIPDELDIYECRFNLAFRTFYIDLVKEERKHYQPLTAIPDQDDTGAEDYDEVFARVAQSLGNLETPESHRSHSELREAILALPVDECRAVILVRFIGYTEKVAATRCSCTPETIRNRLKRAAKRLARFKEGS